VWSVSRPGRYTPGTHLIGWVGPRAGVDDTEKWKFLPPPGLEVRSLGRLARSQSLYRLLCRSQYPGGLRHELSSLARTLGSWVRIPLKAWIFGVYMRLFCVCVVLCVGGGLATSWSLVCEKWLRNWIRGQGPEWSERAIKKYRLRYPGSHSTSQFKNLQLRYSSRPLFWVTSIFSSK
jgi:hypothetical protein